MEFDKTAAFYAITLNAKWQNALKYVRHTFDYHISHVNGFSSRLPSTLTKIYDKLDSMAMVSKLVTVSIKSDRSFIVFHHVTGWIVWVYSGILVINDYST